MRTGWIWRVGIGLIGILYIVNLADPDQPHSAGRVAIVADEKPAMEVLAKFLSANHFHVEVVDPSAMPSPLTAYAAVIMYLHGPMTAAAETAMVDYAKAGGRLIILHHGLASARANNPAWLEMAGVYIAPKNAPQNPWKVIFHATCMLVNLRPGHFITTHEVQYDRSVEYRSSDTPSQIAKFEAVELKDTEGFLNQQFTDGRQKTVLFGFTCTDPETGRHHFQDRGGWYKRWGKGWVFYFQPGHKASDFEHPGYRQIVLNSMIWKPGQETDGD